MTGPDFTPIRDPERPRPARATDVGGVFHPSYWTARGVVPRWQLLLVYLLIAAIGLVGFIRIGNQASNAESLAKQTHALTLATNRLARENAQLTKQIQQQRFDACVDQNKHHDQTLLKLDLVLRKSVADPAIRQRIRKQNALLIDALAPHQNCARLRVP